MEAVKINGNPPETYTVKYSTFKGVDLSTDPTVVDRSRSPYAPNLISDAGGYPEKRVGWRTLKTIGTAKINGLYRLYKAGAEHLIVHCGTKIYRWYADDTATAELKTGVANAPSTAFVHGGKLYILTGTEYLVYDGSTIAAVSSVAYVPTTVISAPPAGGGTAHEAVNLLTPKRKNSFLSSGTATVYQLDSTGITSVSSVTVDGVAVAAEDYTVDLTNGTVTFNTAPAAPSVEGEDNVVIEFSKTVTGYEDAINKCRFAALYGFGGNEGERVFFSGNPDNPNVDWHCEIHEPDYQVDPAYIPDTSFDFIGADANPIMGYRRFGAYQAIIKGQNDQDAAIFLRSWGLDADGNATFSVTQGVSGVGAISRYAFANLGDEALFLSRSGIYGIASTDVDTFHTVQNRSHYVDAQLCREPNLDRACAVEWDNRYLLCVNGNCYVLDGKQNKTYKPQSGGDYVYECYTWTNIPAVCFLEVEGTLYFGTADGRVCMFNTDTERMSRFSDDGAAITAVWTTKADDDGDIGRMKTLPMRGTAVMLKPNTRSSAKFAIVTDFDAGGIEVATEAEMNAFNFADIDFSDFSFETGQGARTYALNTRVRKYITCQIVVSNDQVDEGFGIFGIVKRFRWNRYVK